MAAKKLDEVRVEAAAFGAGGDVVEDELVRTFELAQLDDHVLLKSDGFPTDHLSATLDDELMQITQMMLFEHSKYPNAAKAYMQFMMEADQMNAWIAGSSAYCCQPLKAFADTYGGNAYLMDAARRMTAGAVDLGRLFRRHLGRSRGGGASSWCRGWRACPRSSSAS